MSLITCIQEFVIPSERVEAAHALVERYQKKAKKLGAFEPVLKEVGEFARQVFPEWNSLKEPYFVPYTVLTLEWRPIIISGWVFAAMAETIEEGVNYLTGPQASELVHLRQSRLTCEHCYKNRRRAKHYVLMHPKEGTKVIGSKCLKDFLGYDPGAALFSFEMGEDLTRVLGDADDDYWGSGTVELSASLKAVIRLTLACVRTIGWIKSADSDILAGRIPTAMVVSRNLWDSKMKAEERVAIDPVDDLATEAVLTEWQSIADAVAKAPEKASEWDYKIYALIKKDYVSPLPRYLNVCVGAAYSTHARLTQRAMEKRTPSTFFGKEKERGTWVVEVKGVRVLPGFTYGDQELIYGLIAGTSDKFKIKHSGQFGQLQEGRTYRIKATVKGHEDSEQYGKQTILQRFALLEEVEIESQPASEEDSRLMSVA